MGDLQRAYSLLYVKAFDVESREFSGMATTPTPDRVGDVVEPKGVQFKNPLSLLLYHDNRLPVGHVKFGPATDKGIPFTATIPDVKEPGTLRDRVNEAWQSVKYGLIKGVSIGFRPLEDGIEVLKSGYRFTKTEVVELSLVSVPANSEATIQVIKELDTSEPAALGTSAPDSSTRSGATDATRVVRIAPQKAKTMQKTIQEQRASFEATRQAKSARMTEIMQKAADEGQTLDQTQSEEYDTLETEVKSIDAHLVRLDALEKANVHKAVAVTSATSVDTASTLRGGNAPVIQMQEHLPPGIGFARAVKAAVVASLDRRNMLDVAKEMYPSDNRLHGHITHVLNLPKIVSMMKAAVPAGTTTQTTWANALVDPTNLAGEFIEFLRPATIIGKFGTGNIPSLRRVPFNVRMIEQTQGGTGYWVGQGAPKPLTAFGFAPVTLAFTKVAAISVITEELARFSSPSAETLTRDGLRDALVERIDRDLIDPAEAGTANVQPASLTNGLTALSSSGTSADNARTDLANIMADFVSANQDPAGVVLIMR